MKRYSGKPRGRVNQGGATHKKDADKLNKNFGKNYNSIDFEMSDNLRLDNYKEKTNPIGRLVVGNQKIDLTWSECNKIFTTLLDAQQTHRRKIQLGMFN
tara:strand:+ start:1456 stop:1752 length:297 start_codon:yes stop_codon:yes gene_type:complete